MDIQEAINESYETAKSKGWWGGEEIKVMCSICIEAHEGGHQSTIYFDNNCPACKGEGYTIIKKERTFGDQIALMHSELSEALEEFRSDRKFNEIYTWYFDEQLDLRLKENQLGQKPEGIAVEFADVLIRIFDTCGHYNIPLVEALKLKMEYNKTREHRHGGKKI